jgi:membrane-associated phospholipid phosphatase
LVGSVAVRVVHRMGMDGGYWVDVVVGSVVGVMGSLGIAWFCRRKGWDFLFSLRSR